MGEDMGLGPAGVASLDVHVAPQSTCVSAAATTEGRSRRRSGDLQDVDEDSQFFAGGNPAIENVTDEEFHSNREPMYLPPFVTTSKSSKRSGNKHKKEKRRHKKKHSSRDSDFSLGSSERKSGGMISHNVRLSSSDDSSDD